MQTVESRMRLDRASNIGRKVCECGARAKTRKSSDGKISRRGESQDFWRVKRCQPSADEVPTEADWRDTESCFRHMVLLEMVLLEGGGLSLNLACAKRQPCDRG